MSILGKIFSGGATELVKGVGGVIDNLHTSKEEKLEAEKKIKDMISIDKPVIFDCVVDKAENCFPMIPSGKPHNQMILGPEEEEEISDEGKILV